MSIKTSRANEAASVKVNYETCTVCGRCVEVCKGGPLGIELGRVTTISSTHFGCIACGHCMAVCPNGSIVVDGRDLTPADVRELPEKRSRASYEKLVSLMVSRRSCREFTDEEVDAVIIEKIMEASSSAPMSFPPSDVEALVLAGRAKVRPFCRDIIELIKKFKGGAPERFLKLSSYFMSVENKALYQSFLIPAIKIMVEKYESGVDWLLYDAPLAIYFHSSRYADVADSTIATTYAMLAGESLGLGTCLIGMVGPFLSRDKRLKEKYKIPQRNRSGLLVIFGHPALRYERVVKRRFASVNYY